MDFSVQYDLRYTKISANKQMTRKKDVKMFMVACKVIIAFFLTLWIFPSFHKGYVAQV